MSDKSYSLSQLGWSHFFQQQLSLEEWESTFPARVFSVHRNSVDIISTRSQQQIYLPGSWYQQDSEKLPTIGDWLLLDSATGQPIKILDRKSLFRRKASGRESKVQLIAANIDTLFIVSSCNQDFNLSRLERYLALALETNVEPVLVLTKADLLDDVSGYRKQAMSLKPNLIIEIVNALDPASVEPLLSWCDTGQTVALLGSSGVGKSTLVNTLRGASTQETALIREDDAKGRHTTTSRSMHFLHQGGLLIDSPGLRELQLSECESGVSSLFEDIEELAGHCRFNDCRHSGEDGCAVTTAVTNGVLSSRRLVNYLKLMAEQARNAETIADRRQREKSFGKLCRSVQAIKQKEHNEY
ncbi:MAG: ribosome small subunit-dependent GTPase A [Desulfuromusa sp.]|jgi:ribosome biogenesis GTPase|nr:ribosome small subunit-dependent GTPase A [Desulfuromusa sp.]